MKDLMVERSGSTFSSGGDGRKFGAGGGDNVTGPAN